MRYLSLFSGIEAATSAWHPLGWECVGVAEIEPFPSKVLRHHYPNVRNLGDVTKLTEMDVAELGPIDVVVFGSPCQDLSVAGKRKGLAGARSGLFFTAMQIITWSRLWCGTRFALWENVPGAFSSNKGADFAAVVDELSGLAGTEPPPKGWGTEGCTAGPEAMVEWSTLDAQWFGVAQRRRRVFALADFGDWAGRQPILLEPQGVRGDTAPSRKAGESVTHTVAPCLTSSGRGVDRTGDTRGQDAVVAVCPTLRAGGNKTGGDRPPGTDVDTCESLIPCTAHTLRGEGFDASEDGTGRGTPLVPVAFLHVNKGRPAGRQSTHTEMVTVELDAIPTLTTDGHQQSAICFDTTQVTSAANRSNPKPGYPNIVAFDAAHTTSGVQYAYYSHDFAHDRITDPRGVNPALTANASASGNLNVLAFHSNAQPDQMQFDPNTSAAMTCSQYPAVAFSVALRGRQGGATAELGGEVGNCLRASGGGGDKPHVLAAMQVRRLTPRECERLQGFPDDHTLLPGKAPDGPRYKALGNSMAVPVMRWIGRRIDLALLFQE
jgi:DNA (cytosine-5)-methyltransferase 1